MVLEGGMERGKEEGGKRERERERERKGERVERELIGCLCQGLNTKPKYLP